MSLHRVSDEGYVMAWPTPILLRQQEDISVCFNEDLEDIIKKEKGKSAGIHASNVGGWHSEHTLLTWQGEAILKLEEIIKQAANEMLQMISAEVVENSEDSNLFDIDAWANICSEGDYHSSHYHPNAMLSGVYYVKSDIDNSKNKKNGILAFEDPRYAAGMVSLPGQPFGRPLNISPKTGLLVLFPSWLSHAVHPYSGANERISIAFNINLIYQH